MIKTLVLSLVLLAQSEVSKIGPSSGALVVDGGGENPETIRRFVALAGGVDSAVVLIPTAARAGRSISSGKGRRLRGGSDSRT